MIIELSGVDVLASVDQNQAEILTPEALRFVAKLHRAFTDGRSVTLELIESLIEDELNAHKPSGDTNRLVAAEEAARIIRALVRSEQFVEFLTMPAYESLLQHEEFVTATS